MTIQKPLLCVLMAASVVAGCNPTSTLRLKSLGPIGYETEMTSEVGCCDNGTITYLTQEYGNEAIQLTPYLGSYRVDITRFQWSDDEGGISLVEGKVDQDRFERTADNENPIIFYGTLAGDMNIDGSAEAFEATLQYTCQLGTCGFRMAPNEEISGDDDPENLGGERIYGTPIDGPFASVPPRVDGGIAKQFFKTEQIEAQTFPISWDMDSGLAVFGNGTEMQCEIFDDGDERHGLCFQDLSPMDIDGCAYDVTVAFHPRSFVRFATRPADDACGEGEEITLIGDQST